MTGAELRNEVEPHDAEEPAALPRVFSVQFSAPGLVVGALFFAFSLFASLLPRTALFQGIVSGIAVRTRSMSARAHTGTPSRIEG